MQSNQPKTPKPKRSPRRKGAIEAARPFPPATPENAAYEPKLKEGEEVTIYFDPLSRQIVEAKSARLVSFIKPGEEGTERWWVKFPTAPGSYQRRILPPGMDSHVVKTAEPEVAQ